MMTEKKYTPHIHAEAIKAWSDGKNVEWRIKGSPNWIVLTTRAPAWSDTNEYRVKPEEVVDYTVIFDNGVPGANFRTIKEEIWEYYEHIMDKQGFCKRTTVDGKVVSLEFIPK